MSFGFFGGSAFVVSTFEYPHKKESSGGETLEKTLCKSYGFMLSCVWSTECILDFLFIQNVPTFNIIIQRKYVVFNKFLSDIEL